MEWYWISLITLGVWWVIGIVFVCVIENSKHLLDDYLVIFCAGLLFPIAWVLFYPLRSWNSYKLWGKDYKKNNISFIKYLFGKRINKTKNYEDG